MAKVLDDDSPKREDSIPKRGENGLDDRFCRRTDLAPAPARIKGSDATRPAQRLYFDAHPDSPPGFALRVTSAGAKSFVLNYSANGAQRRQTIGRYGPLSLAAARKLANKLSGQVSNGVDPLEERRRAAAAREAERKAAKARQTFTLAALLGTYCDHLELQGKHSSREVRALVRRVLAPACPPGASGEQKAHAKACATLGEMPAASATPKGLMPLFAGLPPQSARKFRAALRAAFSLAVRSQTDTSLSAFAGFDIELNPVEALRVTLPTRSPDRTKELKRTLTEQELRCYWSRLKDLPTPRHALAALHLLTGGQRPEQLARATHADLDHDAQTLRLLDPKGRRAHAREHVVPLLPDALRAIEALNADKGEHVVTLTRGRKPAHPSTICNAVGEIADAMVEAGEVAQRFTPATLRKTVETRLSQAGVPPEHRDFLQSHNLGTLTLRHYNAHDFLAEKRRALETLWALLQPLPANVAPIRRKSAK